MTSEPRQAAPSSARTITREELYDQVWTTPLRTLASRYGISDVGLAKICRRLNIPRPGVGYWARVQHGQTPRRPPLPSRREAPERATILPTASRPRTARATPPARAAAVVKLSEDLTDSHPAVRFLRKALRQTKPFDGVLTLFGEDLTLVRVSPATGDRALRILDGLFRGLLARGHGVVAKAARPGSGLLVVEADLAGTPIPITINERNSRKEHILPKGENRFRASRWDFPPSNHLILRAGRPYGAPYRTWADGSKRSLEAKLGDAILGIEAIGRQQAEEDRRQAERRRLEREGERARQIAALREQHERALDADLVEMAAAWRQARELRAFLGAVEEGIPLELRTEGVRAWLDWARRRAELRDPLQRLHAIPKRLEPAIPEDLSPSFTGSRSAPAGR